MGVGRGDRRRFMANVFDELASTAGVSPSSLHSWETGQAKPSPKGAIAWAEATKELAASPV